MDTTIQVTGSGYLHRISQPHILCDPEGRCHGRGSSGDKWKDRKSGLGIMMAQRILERFQSKVRMRGRWQQQLT